MDVHHILTYVLLLIFRSSAARSRMVLLRKIVAVKECQFRTLWRLQFHRFYFVVFLSAVTLVHLTVDRSLWRYERSSTWWARIVNQSFNERDWLDNFRMSREMFAYP